MITAIVLAGGTSARMGKDKALADLARRPLVMHVVSALQTIADETIVSVGIGRKDDYRRVLPSGVLIVEDSSSNLGPLEGLLGSTRLARGDWVAISPCDTPFINPDVYLLMLKRAENMDGAVAAIRGYREPLHVVLRREKALMAFERARENALRKVSDALKPLNLAIVGEDSVRTFDRDLLTFWNLNSLADIESAERIVARAQR